MEEEIPIEEQRLVSAVHMLHAEAHGDTALRLCRREPCADLYMEGLTGDATGPAPLTMLGQPR